MLRIKHKFEQKDKVSDARQVFISIAPAMVDSKVLTQLDDIYIMIKKILLMAFLKYYL
mgnify:CR=1 FL=1